MAKHGFLTPQYDWGGEIRCSYTTPMATGSNSARQDLIAADVRIAVGWARSVASSTPAFATDSAKKQLPELYATDQSVRDEDLNPIPHTTNARYSA